MSGPVAAGGPALVFHHGQPGAALVWDGLVSAGSAAGLPVVMLSRPGYGWSDRLPGRKVADAAADVLAVLDELGVGRFVTAGWSGGGPHSLACAALSGGRCVAAATIAGVAPYAGADDLDWTAGMGPENEAEFSALVAGDPGLEERIIGLCQVLADIQPADLTGALGGLLSPPDKAALSNESVASFLAEWFRLAARAGHYGYWDDDHAFVEPWGFSLDTIGIPVHVWVAGDDLMVPPAHGEWLGRHIPAASVRRRDAEGHISLMVSAVGEIVSDLTPAL